MKIAIVGCGIAGTTSAFLLAENGHDVTLFEQAPECRPVGAGFLLQPSGQRILKRLGLLEAAAQNSARIDYLDAQHRSGKSLVELRYEKLDESLFAYGVHRGDVFSVLLDRCHAAGVNLREGCRVTSYQQDDSSVTLQAEQPLDFDSFDILIAADGSKSGLRGISGLQAKAHEYNYAAMWVVGPYSGQTNRLWQIVEGTQLLVGLLPIGDNKCSFFWGLRQDEYPGIQEGGLNAWRGMVVDFVPAAKEILAPVQSLEEVTFATYRDVRMRSVVDGRVVFVGDAAHATSPHLGQGVNLALADAECLCAAMTAEQDFADAFALYEKQRRSTTRFYSQLTGLLTPFFQSDSRILGLGRNIALPVMPKLPYVGRQMVRAMAGLKTGWFK